MPSHTPPMPPGMGRATINDFIQRFNALQLQQAAIVTDELIKVRPMRSKIWLTVDRGVDGRLFAAGFNFNDRQTQLEQENARLVQSLEDVKLDLDHSNNSRRELQKELAATKVRAGDSEVLKNRNPYIMVLIDGDGLLFHDSLVAQGLEGGKQAANLLRNSILQHCQGLPEDIEIIAKICANVTGLSIAMNMDDADHLKKFTLGFTQGKASFDFVDVGYGKERADSKIKERMRWHLRNHNCKQILLGVSHDAGYAPFLDEIVSVEDRPRITIMEGPPTVRELRATGLRVISFQEIFRTEKLVARLPAAPPSWAGVSSVPPIAALAPLPPPPSTSPVMVNKGSTNVISVMPIKKPAAKPTWEPGPRGLDPPLNHKQSVLDRVKVRNPKLCNNHYLRGQCMKDGCTFEHNYKPNEEEIKAISYLSRLNPCTSGQDCDQEACIYGHHCPSVQFVGMNGKPRDPVCQAFCRFSKDDHPPGCVIKNPRKERWERKDESYF
ncbi:C-x8-C-x5-C-x3-H type zinc finger protein-like protein [Amylocarpus encephaloides]|uniref:C-x8-C-x5-C-x3-H type zinc finger protein-like protein n=1 Tax=Amylocarpus encephaloides TaxID=45428 RepID=A0A9P7YHD4_9HELO|nr:C-x8-C-x5-C-x3-H type zinc finger protein-like protein [Amylocarpus encephaloides]